MSKARGAERKRKNEHLTDNVKHRIKRKIQTLAIFSLP
jgi:hypothetical protein